MIRAVEGDEFLDNGQQHRGRQLTVGDAHALSVPYADGSDLFALVKQHGPLPIDQAVDCILQAARGRQYAQEHSVVHRGIKPANLPLDGQGTVKILDMGLARLDSAGGRLDDALLALFRSADRLIIIRFEPFTTGSGLGHAGPTCSCGFPSTL
jgi:serine/threonine protein kinase